jgi:hypothetical protein
MCKAHSEEFEFLSVPSFAQNSAIYDVFSQREIADSLSDKR